MISLFKALQKTGLQNEIIFPKQPLSLRLLNERIDDAVKNNINYTKDFIIGYPGSNPLPISLRIFAKFAPLNPNNIGTHTRIESESGFKGTQQLEIESIEMIGNLFNSSKNNPIDGYVSSGGTEGELMGLWILRNMIMEKFNINKIMFLINPLTHYSIKKSFNVLGLKHYQNIEVDENFQISLNSLESKISILKLKDFNHFVIICTIGYTVTGSVDPIDEINEFCNVLEKKYGVKIFIHIDACHGGFIYPFLTKNNLGFNLKRVMTLALDAHKTGLLPYSCGVFICRKNLQKYIETNVNYIRSHKDDTLIGSRSGAMAASLWSSINATGKDGYRVIYSKCIKRKNNFIKKLKQKGIEFWFYTNELSNIIALEFTNLPNKQLSKELEIKYGLNLSQISNVDGKREVYKLVFMPHVTNRITDSLIKDILEYK